MLRVGRSQPRLFSSRPPGAEEVRTHWLLPFTDYFYHRISGKLFSAGRFTQAKTTSMGLPKRHVACYSEWGCGSFKHPFLPQEMLASARSRVPLRGCGFGEHSAYHEVGEIASPYLPPQHRGLPFQPQFTKGETPRPESRFLWCPGGGNLIDACTPRKWTVGLLPGKK